MKDIHSFSLVSPHPWPWDAPSKRHLCSLNKPSQLAPGWQTSGWLLPDLSSSFILLAMLMSSHPYFRWGSVGSERSTQILRGDTVSLGLTSDAIFLQGDCMSSVLVWVNYFFVFLLILHRKTSFPLFSGLRWKHSVLFLVKALHLNRKCLFYCLWEIQRASSKNGWKASAENLQSGKLI